MARLVRGAKALRSEILEMIPKAKVGDYGEPDGFEVIRSLRVGDKPSSKRLAPILEYLADRRIEESHLTDDDYLIVTFKATPVADERGRFLLGEAEDAMKEGDPDSGS